MAEIRSMNILRRPAAAVAASALGSLLLVGCGNDTQPGPGYDVSYPQCSLDELPEARSYAIVGLNNGVAKSLNPCFEEQMEWASESAGDTSQPKASIYINSGNPGSELASSWPSTGSYQGESCEGGDTKACAYEYGRSLIEWNIKAFNEQYGEKNDTDVSDIAWWIDVEVGNSWLCNEGLDGLCSEQNGELRYKNAIPIKEGARGLNASVLNGMVAELQKNDIQPGIYTDASSWKLIIGNQGRGTMLEGLDVWIAGARTEQAARERCSQGSFNGLGRIVLSQYNADVQKDLDQNVIC